MPPTSPRRAVFTGLGVLSAVGSDHATFWQSLVTGKSGIRPMPGLENSALPCRIAGVMPTFDAKQFIPPKPIENRKSLKVMARTVQMGVCAAQRAMENAGLHKGQIPPVRFGVEFGCVMVATELEDLSRGSKTSTNCTPGAVNMAAWGKEGMNLVPPLWMLKYLPNMPACHVSIQHDAQGPNNTITAGDAAGLLALGEAYRILARNLADAFLVGGCESRLNPVTLSRHALFQPFTKAGNDRPETALRPFDAARTGTAPGEGAVVYILEELDLARRRNATILAELVGFASGFDRGRKGPVLAGVIRNALKDAGILPADVDHVNAAAGGHPELDAFEARAIAEVFGKSVPVFAPRAHIGSLGAASGPVELAASVLALQHGQLPGTLNHDAPDPACPVSVHVGAPRAVTKPYALKLSYTDLGQCAAVVVKKWEG